MSVRKKDKPPTDQEHDAGVGKSELNGDEIQKHDSDGAGTGKAELEAKDVRTLDSDSLSPASELARDPRNVEIDLRPLNGTPQKLPTTDNDQGATATSPGTTTATPEVFVASDTSPSASSLFQIPFSATTSTFIVQQTASQAVSIQSPTTSPVPTTPPTTTTALSTAAIIGIIVGIIAFVLLKAGCMFWLGVHWRRRRKFRGKKPGDVETKGMGVIGYKQELDGFVVVGKDCWKNGPAVVVTTEQVELEGEGQIVGELEGRGMVSEVGAQEVKEWDGDWVRDKLKPKE
ncbi:hypothetical protein K458DRAFT_386013 [Lentithecium fluviatile CBS 122367]|uniref:Uncharacterized protein n=1 Tax=Lentithecium fluviatile CBS 122367 TaxID=1168545 RepID=A0A6G1JAM6_9PLEO|nr:hypothetical protein K458DRAFT_386013 [Lentithecium fluviatile CBS 122367]